MSRLNPKGWNEIKTNDSWAIFKIMGEFVNGFEKMSKIGPCVSIFGSAIPSQCNPSVTISVAGSPCPPFILACTASTWRFILACPPDLRPVRSRAGRSPLLFCFPEKNHCSQSDLGSSWSAVRKFFLFATLLNGPAERQRLRGILPVWLNKVGNS